MRSFLNHDNKSFSTLFKGVSMCSREESQGGQLIPGLPCSSLARAGLGALVSAWHRLFFRAPSAWKNWLLWRVRAGKGRDSVSQEQVGLSVAGFVFSCLCKVWSGSWQDQKLPLQL